MVQVNGGIVADSIVEYGREIQSVVCMEECSELIQAVSKQLRECPDRNPDNLAEEMADVYICLRMLTLIYDVRDDEIQKWVDQKQTRMKQRIAERQNADEDLPFPD